MQKMASKGQKRAERNRKPSLEREEKTKRHDFYSFLPPLTLFSFRPSVLLLFSRRGDDTKERGVSYL